MSDERDRRFEARGARNERDRIVEYLRAAAKGAQGSRGRHAGPAYWADMIERCDHARGEE